VRPRTFWSPLVGHCSTVLLVQYCDLFDVGLSSLSEVEQGVQHVLADIMAKDIEIINATRLRYAASNCCSLLQLQLH